MNINMTKTQLAHVQAVLLKSLVDGAKSLTTEALAEGFSYGYTRVQAIDSYTHLLNTAIILNQLGVENAADTYLPPFSDLIKTLDTLAA